MMNKAKSMTTVKIVKEFGYGNWVFGNLDPKMYRRKEKKILDELNNMERILLIDDKDKAMKIWMYLSK